MSFVAGLVEVFASYRNENGNSAWNAKKSDGEKLSLLRPRAVRHRLFAVAFSAPWIETIHKPFDG
jgi:hypothetical protein